MNLRLPLLSAAVKNAFGVAVRLIAALEYQVAGGLERDIATGILGEPAIPGICSVLPVDDDGHPVEGVQHLFA